MCKGPEAETIDLSEEQETNHHGWMAESRGRGMMGKQVELR